MPSFSLPLTTTSHFNNGGFSQFYSWSMNHGVSSQRVLQAYKLKKEHKLLFYNRSGHDLNDKLMLVGLELDFLATKRGELQDEGLISRSLPAPALSMNETEFLCKNTVKLNIECGLRKCWFPLDKCEMSNL